MTRRLFSHHRHRRNNNTKQRSWKGYFRCDDLMPPLCGDDLVITQHMVEGLKDAPITEEKEFYFKATY
jgi:hypothetical protein